MTIPKRDAPGFRSPLAGSPGRFTNVRRCEGLSLVPLLFVKRRGFAVPDFDMIYCKSLKYSGNNKIAIIALCTYALL